MHLPDSAIVVDVREAGFDSQELEQRLTLSHAHGAIVTFVGRVRDYGDQANVVGIHLEHYPAMTARVLLQHCQQAMQRWPLGSIVLIHRVGTLTLGEPIMGIAIASSHRQDAFDAVQFLMDFLKHNAPFWKQELTTDGGASWVEQKSSDVQRLQQWRVTADAASNRSA